MNESRDPDTLAGKAGRFLDICDPDRRHRIEEILRSGAEQIRQRVITSIDFAAASASAPVLAAAAGGSAHRLPVLERAEGAADQFEFIGTADLEEGPIEREDGSWFACFRFHDPDEAVPVMPLLLVAREGGRILGEGFCRKKDGAAIIEMGGTDFGDVATMCAENCYFVHRL